MVATENWWGFTFLGWKHVKHEEKKGSYYCSLKPEVERESGLGEDAEESGVVHELPERWPVQHAVGVS